MGYPLRSALLVFATQVACVGAMQGESSDASGPIVSGDSGCPAVGECGEPEPDPEPVASCDAPPTEPLLPVELLLECCDGARCVPAGFVSADEVDSFAECAEASVCVPELFIETQGFFTLAVCESIAGIEGRCASICLPDVADRADTLPQSTCAPNERCTPCWDPFTGEESGICALACDAGPTTEWAPVFATCCNDDSGHCIPAELVPDEDEGSLEECVGGGLCVPDALQDPAFAPPPCTGANLLGTYDGVCLTDCLALPLEFTLDAAPCPPAQVCVPCQGLFGEPSGAPGCD